MRTNTMEGPEGGARNSTDRWVMTTPGGELAMTLNYTTGNRGWSSAETSSFSAANPDFYRIYRYDSITEVVMSTPLGKPVAGEFRMTSSVPGLAGIFNGQEETVAILDIPVRVRKIFLP